MAFSEKSVALQDLVNSLNLGDVTTLRSIFNYSGLLEQCYESRATPITYLSRTFKYAVTLLSVMFDSGCVITGPRALDFFFPASSDKDSAWTFYVPGYKESVMDMVNVLEECGVSWHLCANEILKTLREQKLASVSHTVFECLLSWTTDLDQSAAEKLLGQQLFSMLRSYECLDREPKLKADHFLVSTLGGTMEVIPQAPMQFGDRRSSSANSFGRLRGEIQTELGPQTVEIVFGSCDSAANSCMSFLKGFYASHLQCFISGWCAGHMHYELASSKRAALWRPWPGQTFIDAYSDVPKSQCVGFTFSHAESTGPQTRSLRDAKSFLLDYGDLFRRFVRKSHQSILDCWLSERRENIDGISWTEFDGRIFSVQDIFSARHRRSRMAFATHSVDLPLDRLRRLSNMIAVNTTEPDELRTDTFRSSVGACTENPRWQVADLARSGTILDNLRDATPWSWAL